jgi:hypothetical protein
MRTNLRRTTRLVVLALCLAASGRLAAAQDPPAGPPAQGQRAGQRGAARGARGGEPGALTNPTAASAEVQDMLNALVLGRAQAQLNLTAEQYAAFFPRMKQLQDLRTRHARERGRLLNQLRILTRAPEGADEATLDARTKALDALEASIAQEEQKAMAVVDSGLTVWQRARFRVFEENMENEKLRMLAKVLKTAPPAPPPPIKK